MTQPRAESGDASSHPQLEAPDQRAVEAALAELRGTRVGVALSGGVFQNKVLLEQVVRRLDEQGYEVLTQSRVPANDGGLALGQAAIAAARACA